MVAKRESQDVAVRAHGVIGQLAPLPGLHFRALAEPQASEGQNQQLQDLGLPMGVNGIGGGHEVSA